MGNDIYTDMVDKNIKGKFYLQDVIGFCCELSLIPMHGAAETTVFRDIRPKSAPAQAMNPRCDKT